MNDVQANRRDIFILVGLMVLLIALVVVADMRAKSYETVLVAGSGASVAEGKGDSNGKDGNGNAVRYKNTLEFLKIVVLITVIFILFIALSTTIIILLIRVVQRRISKAPPPAGSG